MNQQPSPIIERLHVQLARLRRLFNRVAAEVSSDARQRLDAVFSQMEQELRLADQRMDQLEQRLARFPQLTDAMTSMNASLEPETVLEEVMDAVIALTGTERAYLMLLEDGELRVKVARNWDQSTLSEGEISVSRGIVELALDTRDVIYTSNAQADERFRERTSVLEKDLYLIVCIPLLLRGEPIGVLYTDNHDRTGQLHADSIALLRTFANQAAIAIDNARLYNQLRGTAAALQQAREHLVTTREEERRRLRRDLHDGLGAALSGITLGLTAARSHLHQQPERTDTMLSELKQDVQDTLADVRRLIYNLRPPLLDELGLAEALREFIRGLQTHDLQIQLVTDVLDGQQFSMSAAVEVALYRIATEAVTNAIRHAQAGSCTISFAYHPEHGQIALTVADNGRGFPRDGRMGVGLHSMRERAEEVGGNLRVESPCTMLEPEGTGTCVTAMLPVENRPG